MIKLGIFRDSNEVYHAAEHIGSTSLKKMAISPGHFLESWKGPKAESKAFDEGNLVHQVLLEQSLDGFVRRPDGVDGRTKAGKEILTELEATGKKVMTADVYDSMNRRLESFTKSTEALRLYDHAEIEMSHYAHDAETGLFIKCRPDMMKHGMICDLKTTQMMSTFEKQIWNLQYFVQLGYYALVAEITTGTTIRELKFIAQEKTAPYGIQVFALDRATVDFSKARARELLNRVAVCIADNHFPIYDDTVKVLSVPAWLDVAEFSFFEEVG